MEERIYTLHIAEKYIVLVAAVRLLRDGGCNIEKVQKFLDLSIFKEEPFYYTGLYANLIEAVMHNKALEFIDSFLHDVESESMYYDDDIEADFRELRDYCSKIYLLTHKIEEQLMYKVYLALSDTYRYHKDKAIDYMCKSKILNEIRVYKNNGTVINKSMIFLDTTITISSWDIDQMEKLAFHL